MRNILFFCLLWSMAMAAQASETTRFTIYQGGGAWVEQEIPLPSQTQSHAQWSVELPASLAPESLQAMVPGHGALRVSLTPPLGGLPDLLAECVGQQVRLLPAGSAQGGLEVGEEMVLLIQARGGDALVQTDGGAVAAVDGRRVLCHPARTQALWSMASPLPAGSSKVNLRYRLGDGWWRALHFLDLDEERGRARLHTRAELHLPATSNLAEAQVRLVAGDVPDHAAPAPTEGLIKAARSFDAAASPNAAESSRQDLLFFDLDRSVPINGPRVELLELRASQEVDVEDILQLRGPAPNRVANDDGQRLTARRLLRFAAPKGQPLPAGLTTVGLVEPGGGWSALGRRPLQRTAPGETAELMLGEVRDLVVEWSRPKYAALGNELYRHSAQVVIRIENPRDRSAQIEFIQQMGGAHELVEASPRPDKRSGASATWWMTLEPGASTEISFTARVDRKRR